MALNELKEQKCSITSKLCQTIYVFIVHFLLFLQKHTSSQKKNGCQESVPKKRWSVLSPPLEGLENSGFSTKELSAQRFRPAFLYHTSNASQFLFLANARTIRSYFHSGGESVIHKLQENLELECLHKLSMMEKDNQP